MLPVESPTCVNVQVTLINMEKNFRDGEGFLVVYSIANRSTFERVERFRDQITRVKDSEDIPMILVGNHCHKITEREVSREEGMNMARRLKSGFIESSDR